MCNLYSITRNRDAIIQLFKVPRNRAAAFEPLPAVFPGNAAPVIRQAANGGRELAILSWGFVLPQAGKAAKRVTNARGDRTLASRFWQPSFEARRCLVPVTAFAEPKGQRPAVWHWFGLDDERTPFAFAGIWRPWSGRLKPGIEPVALDVFAILTTDPNAVVAPIHPTRMPEMLFGAEAYDTWLTGSLEQALALARPYSADGMRVVAKGDKQDIGVG